MTGRTLVVTYAPDGVVADWVVQAEGRDQSRWEAAAQAAGRWNPESGAYTARPDLWPLGAYKYLGNHVVAGWGQPTWELRQRAPGVAEAMLEAELAEKSHKFTGPTGRRIVHDTAILHNLPSPQPSRLLRDLVANWRGGLGL